jgi:Flp pilus assembly protein TadD
MMEELYHAALEVSGEERAALLARSDPEIRRSVEILLAQGSSGGAVRFDYCFLGRAYEQKGRLPEAIATFQRGLTLEGNTELWSGLGHAYAASGNKAEAQKVLDHLKELSTHSYVAPYNVAVIYVGLGEKDEAFAWLNRAYEERSYILAEYLTTDARLDTLHSDPRFAELVRRIGLPQ